MPPSSVPPDDAAPRTVPFAGRRRNARALAGGALLVALALLPNLTPAIAPSIALVSIRLASSAHERSTCIPSAKP